ncbi:UDP binding domain-containing protein [Syntrophomonas palmitatica]|uniref:UDP binding domain-containing protein n=1 Tax=Syntrophomonas palmitatica TaxID=402877 RepID=UPI00241FF5C1|nr:UDP binding domain-containing protein [Syntrophomonas palmitatica]
MENDIYMVVKDADMILILTDHDEFKSLDYNKLASHMRTSLLFDTRNILPTSAFTDSKLKLINLGNLFEHCAL